MSSNSKIIASSLIQNKTGSVCTVHDNDNKNTHTTPDRKTFSKQLQFIKLVVGIASVIVCTSHNPPTWFYILNDDNNNFNSFPNKTTTHKSLNLNQVALMAFAAVMSYIKRQRQD